MVQCIRNKAYIGNLVLNLDIDEVFDYIECPFLFQVLRRFGFSENWTRLISSSLTASSFSVLFHGIERGIFSSTGVQQGDPISPSPFIIFTEELSRSVTRDFYHD